MQNLILKKIIEWVSKRVKMIVIFVVTCVIVATIISYAVQHIAR